VIFYQYLRSTTIPVLEYQQTQGQIKFRFQNCIDQFQMPVRWGEQQLTLSTQWTTWPGNPDKDVQLLDGNYYWTLRRVN
jgi:hypothetical protein